ncbi:hypothetical protein [Guptibacillus hwajinpoensis]|uniref:hypothetical protein n=1 Tax=Guptibacillus hwajinpoensis TaxID=208199 RepID=UPI001CFCE7C2|nr:hypothetical protein [Pseudalkalibacillus hwajinpoensis]WLR58679.1 hypothetical protein LC071_16110 [Pseudalkalibacillus hwajinpoensis]
MFDHTKHIPLEGIPGEMNVSEVSHQNEEIAEMSFPFDYSLMIPLDHSLRDE